jgi:hypothetical protein
VIQSLQILPSLLTMDNSSLILNSKQLTILTYLYRFRFLTSLQLQKLLNDKTLRLTNYHLKILTSQNYINKHYSRTLGLANQPAVYFLAPRSIKILENTDGITARGLKRIYREKIRSPQFIAHASFIADYYLFLRDDSIKTKLTLYFFTKSDLEVHPYIIHPLPDAYFARVDDKEQIKRYFLEVIEEGTPRFAIRKRVEQYDDYIEEGKFEKVTRHPFPTILFICPTAAILVYLKKHLERIFEETSLDQASVYLASREQAFAGVWEKIDLETIDNT